MQAVVLSDIHSNCYALSAVLDEVSSINVDEVWILGDTFGYYPWAVEVFDLLQPYLQRTRAILGNHDDLLLRREEGQLSSPLLGAALHNRKRLLQECPEGFAWLHSLPPQLSFDLESRHFQLVHGTPDDPLHGRFYPDNTNAYAWFPKAQECLFLGHTHYPLERRINHGGQILNPGSVGQPRDGSPSASWGLFDISNAVFSLRRTPYKHLEAISALEAMQWDSQSINALSKQVKAC